MKLLISIISIVALSFSPMESALNTSTETVNTAVVNEQLTFDGYEGEYYFFTDTNYEAVVLEANQKLPIDLINGNYEGKKLEVSYEAVNRTQDSSSEGVIKSVKLSE